MTDSNKLNGAGAPEEAALQRLFDDTAPEPSALQLSRMEARASEIATREAPARWLPRALVVGALAAAVAAAWLAWPAAELDSREPATSPVVEKAPAEDAALIAEIDEMVLGEALDVDMDWSALLDEPDPNVALAVADDLLDEIDTLTLEEAL